MKRRADVSHLQNELEHAKRTGESEEISPLTRAGPTGIERKVA